MKGQVYRFYLKLDENTYFYVQGDSVFTSSAKIALQSSPMDWGDLELKINRNETTWGIFTKNAESLTFTLDGAKILKRIFRTQCYEGKCILLIEEYNPTTFQYDFWGDGDIDFSAASDDDPIITVNIEPRGLNALINNRRDIPYQIPLDDPQALNIKVDGLKIRNVVAFTPVYYNPNGIRTVEMTALYRLSELGTGVIPNSTSTALPAFYTAVTNEPIQVVFKNVKLSSQFGAELRIWKSIGGGPPIDVWIHDQASGNIVNETVVLPANPGDTFILKLFAAAGGSVGGWAQISDVDSLNKASFEVTAVMRFQATTHKAFRYIHFLQKLVSKITDGQFTVQSDFLSNTNTSTAFRKANYGNSPWNTLVTSGNGVRGLTGSTIKTTLTEAFKDGWSRWTLSYGIEGNVLRIEPLSYFLNKNLNVGSIDLLSDERVKITPYMEKVANQIKIGYGEYKYDELSGKQEFNTTLTMMYDKVIRDKKVDDCVSPYRADMFGWEKLRNYLNAQAVLSPQIVTKDNESDNDTFLIEVDPVPVGGYYPPFRAAVSTITGFDYPESAYNCFMTPKDAFLRHLSRIRSTMPIADRGNAIFQVLDKSSDFSINYTGIPGEAVVEKANVPLTSNSHLGRDCSLLYVPFKFTANVVPTKEMRIALQNEVYGYVTIKGEDQDYKGFTLDTILKTARDNSGKNVNANIILLAHPDTILAS